MRECEPFHALCGWGFSTVEIQLFWFTWSRINDKCAFRKRREKITPKTFTQEAGFVSCLCWPLVIISFKFLEFSITVSLHVGAVYGLHLITDCLDLSTMNGLRMSTQLMFFSKTIVPLRPLSVYLLIMVTRTTKNKCISFLGVDTFIEPIVCHHNII